MSGVLLNDPRTTAAEPDRFSIPLDGKEIAFGPFPFRPRSLIVVNQLASATVIVTDDRGEQYTAAPSVAVTYGVSDTVRLRAKIDVPQTAGKATLIVSPEAGGIASAQLQSFAVRGSTVMQILAPANFPPANPQDGDLVALQVDATNGVLWVFRYNAGSSSGFKWEFIGGSPLSHEIPAAESTVSTNYVDLATVGPTVTLPRSGDYDVSFGAHLLDASNAGNILLAAIKRGSAATSDSDAIQYDHGAQGVGVSSGSSVQRDIRVGFLASGDAVKVQYRIITGQLTAQFRWIKVTPVRIG